MKLFLASSAGRTINLFEKEFFSLKNKKVAFIANAADTYERKPFVNFDKHRLKDYGATIIDIDLRKIRGEKLYKKLADMDIIFVAGGNVFYLLESMQKSRFDRIIRRLLDSGIVYVGSSAGSCVAAQDITPISTLDEPEKAKSLKSYKALNLTKTLVLPHVNSKKYRPKCLAIKKKYGKKYDLELLNDNQVLIINGTKKKIMRSGICPSLIKTAILYQVKKNFSSS